MNKKLKKMAKKTFQNKKRTFRKTGKKHLKTRGKRKSLRGGGVRSFFFGKSKEQIAEDNAKAKVIIQNSNLNKYFEKVSQIHDSQNILHDSKSLYEYLKNNLNSKKELPKNIDIYLFNLRIKQLNIDAAKFRNNEINLKNKKAVKITYEKGSDELFSRERDLLHNHKDLLNLENPKLYKDLKYFFEWKLYLYIETLRNYIAMTKIKQRNNFFKNDDINKKKDISTNPNPENLNNTDDTDDTNNNQPLSTAPNEADNVSKITPEENQTEENVLPIPSEVSSLPATQEPQNQDSNGYTAGGRRTRKKMQYPNKKPTLYIL